MFVCTAYEIQNLDKSFGLAFNLRIMAHIP